ncbi:Hypothetical predicted protein [Paramuricea clavata]|uniref:Uncharacterized protein n=1 Tax=Paramuricea clavata TaxID=317549 RepID=A0A7D9I6H9_PARCT|nr:Hypothetical predicted protein [Paramuricea clavata]
MAEFTSDHSLEPDAIKEEQTAIQNDIKTIFKELIFLKKRVANLETQLLRESCALCNENLCDVPDPHAVLQPTPEL